MNNGHLRVFELTQNWRTFPRMNDTQRFEWLRSEYRQRWDAFQVLAYRNAELAHEGQPPSPGQLADAERAAVAVERARDDLLAAAQSQM